MVRKISEENGYSLFELTDGDIRLRLCDFGASVYSVEYLQKDGNYKLVSLSCGSIPEFVAAGTYFGATCGRTVNRIRDGRFTIDGREYQLTVNENTNSAHGGKTGWALKKWESRILDDGSVEFTIKSDDGEEGYPGNVTARAVYTLKDNKILIHHTADTDKDTIINMTNHTYWCIGGAEKIYDQVLRIDADDYLELRDDLIPTGRILPVKGTAFDFTVPKPVGKDINDSHPMVVNSRGYDVSFVRRNGELPGTAAVLYDPSSKLELTVYTSYPDIHIYTANFLDRTIRGADGRMCDKHDAVCLEAEYFPDAINNPGFGKMLLRKGQKYDEFIEYRFKQL